MNPSPQPVLLNLDEAWRLGPTEQHLSNEEISAAFERANVTLSEKGICDTHEAISQFMKRQGGKHFPTPSETKRELERISKTFDRAAEVIDGSELGGLDLRCAVAGHVDRTMFHEILRQLVPSFKRKKSVENAASILASLRAVAAPWSDTVDIQVRMSLDIIRLIESQERRRTERLMPGIPAALRWLASCARDAIEVVEARDLTGEWPRLNLIKEIFEIYEESGGRSRLSYNDGKGRLTQNSAGGRYSGEFFKLISVTLHLIGISQTNQQLGNAIKKTTGP